MNYKPDAVSGTTPSSTATANAKDQMKYGGIKEIPSEKRPARLLQRSVRADP